MPRRAAKVDDNHAEIVDACLECGASVQSLAAVGCGCPDLLVGIEGRNYLIEIKDGNKSPSRRELSDWQKKFRERWKGQLVIVTSAAEIYEMLVGRCHD